MVRSAQDIRCSFCGKSQREVTRLIAGPRAAYICDACVSHLRATPPVGSSPDRFQANERCSFCGNAHEDIQWIAAAGEDARICNRCVDLCSEIITEPSYEYPHSGDAVQPAPTAPPSYDRPLSHAFDLAVFKERALRYQIVIDEDAHGMILVGGTDGSGPSGLQFFHFLTDVAFGIWTNPEYTLSGWSIVEIMRVKGYSDAEARELIFAGRSMRELFNLPGKEPNGQDAQG